MAKAFMVAGIWSMVSSIMYLPGYGVRPYEGVRGAVVQEHSPPYVPLG